MAIDYIGLFTIGIGFLSAIIILVLFERKFENEESFVKDKIKEPQLNIQQLIDAVMTTSESEVETLLEACALRLLIPNWYTKTDMEIILERQISDTQWAELLINKSDDIGDETILMIKNHLLKELQPKKLEITVEPEILNGEADNLIGMERPDNLINTDKINNFKRNERYVSQK